ncbi:MAG: hypothetical protein DRR19_02255 [Candidatus Parabeggiatoa sp. nov. 1]|nr:MAG: hypothetical protein DRR19_02255 [Gammaproteobacteria bacterium]
MALNDREFPSLFIETWERAIIHKFLTACHFELKMNSEIQPNTPTLVVFFRFIPLMEMTQS